MRSRRPPSALKVLPLLILAAPSAWAQDQAGGEFRVNGYTTGAQTQASVTPRSDGSWMVAWQTVGEDGSDLGVWGKHYDRFGVVHGPDFQCNTYTTGVQGGPSITTGTHSGAVAWHSINQDGSLGGVYAQRLTATHGLLGPEFRVNTFTPGYQYRPSVSMSPGGQFVVAWHSEGIDGATDYAVMLRRYDNLGQALTGEVRANLFTAGDQMNPAVAQGSLNGDFVVVWQSENQDGGRDGIFGQRFNRDGARLGPEFRVNTYTLNEQRYPAVAMADKGQFVVAWQSYLQEGAMWGIYAQLFAADGTPVGPEMHVNGFTTNDQILPVVGMDAEANFVIAWESFTQDGDQGGIFARRYDRAGAPRGAAFRVNTTAGNDQFDPSLGIDRVGNFMAAWTSTGQDGGDQGVYAQRYGGLLPAPPNYVPDKAAIVVDPPPGNFVFEPGETVAMQPAWENASGGQQAFTGVVTEFEGPPPSQYIIVDETASYAIAAPNVIQRCTASTNCFVLTITAPPTRPSVHWDATILESISPQTQGQVKRWRLHVGDSFTDVPRTSPFYRFVETMLHTGVTGGCGGTNFCPGSTTNRDTMAVFVLLAKEGEGYSPPNCTTPVFADVPAASPFCKWIEELYRRGIVGGCATNPLRYCPTNVVTREQMSVFLLLTLDTSINPPACTTPPFEDVPIDSPFCRWIQELVARGITGGCAPNRFCPGNPVTREQMSVFLTTTFNLTLYGSQ